MELSEQNSRGICLRKLAYAERSSGQFSLEFHELEGCFLRDQPCNRREIGGQLTMSKEGESHCNENLNAKHLELGQCSTSSVGDLLLKSSRN